METSKADSILFFYSPFSGIENIIISPPNNTESKLNGPDNKIHFNLDDDGYINSKYKYLKISYLINQKIWKSNSIIYIDNNKNLEKYLIRLFNRCNLLEEEIKILCHYWTNNLLELECLHFKCEIFFDEKTNNFFPIEVNNNLSYANRSFIKFTPVGKKGKDSFLAKEFIPRVGDARLVEIIGAIG